MNLALLAYEMRAAGIKSLAIELDGAADATDSLSPRDAATLPPDAPEPEQKAPDACAAPGCTNEKGGIFGGIGGDLCRTHALQRAGVRT